MFSYLLPENFQSLKHVLVRHFYNVAAQQDNDIQAVQFYLMLSKALADKPFDAVARDCCFCMFARNGQTQARTRLRIIVPEYGKIFITGSFCAGKHPLEIFRLGQALFAAKSLACRVL